MISGRWPDNGAGEISAINYIVQDIEEGAGSEQSWAEPFAMYNHHMVCPCNGSALTGPSATCVRPQLEQRDAQTQGRCF